jgi:hypothetical protein
MKGSAGSVVSRTAALGRYPRRQRVRRCLLPHHSSLIQSLEDRLTFTAIMSHALVTDGDLSEVGMQGARSNT